jgi:hypothetical protein
LFTDLYNDIVNIEMVRNLQCDYISGSRMRM